MRSKSILYHNYLFIFGFLYYLIFPAIIGQNGLLDEYPGMDTFYAYFPDNRQIIVYYFLCYILLVSFFIGTYLAKRYKKNKVFYLSDYHNKVNFNWLIFLVLVLLDQYLIISNRGLLFSGYTEGYHFEILGQLATMNCVFLFVYLYCKISLHRSKITTLFGLLVIENSIVLIGFGSRMFVLIPFIAYIIYLSDNNIINIKRLVLYFGVFCILCLIIGVLREGADTISIESMLYIGFAEPIYTWVTAGSYIKYNDISLLSFPYNIIGHFINVIPSVLLPNKSNLIPSLNSAINYVSPFGATSLVPKLYGNFGLVLTPVVTVLASFLLTVLRYSHKRYMKTLYYCSCAMIPFLLFRDLRSVNKLLLASYIIYPSLLFVFKIKNTRNFLK